MKLKRSAGIGIAMAVGALAVPGVAGAHIKVGVDSVRQHTDRADKALDRAVALFEANSDRRGAQALSRSRKEMGLATAEAAKLRRSAGSQNERARAAQAQALVGDQQDENVPQLVGLLDEADGRVENTIAKAALSDTRGRDKAIAVITAIIGQGVSPEASKGLTKALSSLATGRDKEVEVEVQALVDRDVSSASKRQVAKSVAKSVDGQKTAAQRLAQLIASEDMPAESKQGLQRAYDAVTREQESSADVLSRFSNRLPSFVRSFVEQVVKQARENAQDMRENRPAPPSGGSQPEGTPTGQPETTPTGQPQGTPTGQPTG